MIRLARLFTITLMLVVCMVYSASIPAEAADIVTVKINGMAPEGQEKLALEDAKKKAVFKVFSHDTRPERDPGSIFAQIMERYGDYVESSKVLKKMSKDKKCLVIAEVGVNHSKLQEDFQSLVGTRQQVHDTMTATIILRAVNTSDNHAHGESARQAFEHRFQQQGFQTEDEDDDIVFAKQQLVTADYNAYIGSMKTQIDNNSIMANFAMVGEVALDSLASGSGGYTAQATVRINAYDCVRKVLVGSFQEDYEMLGATAQDAERMVLQKASMDAAEKIANDTLKYWRSLAG